MTTPSEDEGLHIIQPDKPKPRLLQSAASKVEREPLEVITRSGMRRLKFLGILSIVTILCVIGVVIWMEQQQRSWVGISIGESNSSLSAVTPEMLRVTSIALGDHPLAVVNGQGVAKGDSLVLKTAAGNVNLLVTKIEDGVVQFDFGGQKIDAKLPPEFVQKQPR